MFAFTQKSFTIREENLSNWPTPNPLSLSLCFYREIHFFKIINRVKIYQESKDSWKSVNSSPETIEMGSSSYLLKSSRICANTLEFLNVN